MSKPTKEEMLQSIDILWGHFLSHYDVEHREPYLSESYSAIRALIERYGERPTGDGPYASRDNVALTVGRIVGAVDMGRIDIAKTILADWLRAIGVEVEEREA